ncbi:hypothetical protein PR002_g31741, partial [Phytophthora rubi]
LITEVNTAVDAGGKKQRQRSVQAVVAEARQVELAAMNQGRSDGKDAPQTVARKKTRRDESRATATAVAEKNKTEDEWFECMRQYALELPEELVEEGTLAEMRAARRSAAKAVKRYKIARRGYRLQRRRRMMDQVRAAEAAKPVQQRRRIKRGYHYERQGHYGDVELVPDAKSKPLRTAQLRATGASSPSCLPTALLALSKAHTQEVLLDSCAQFSVAGRDLRNASRWMPFSWMAKVKFLVGEDWMADKQVKMDFGSRELKYREADGQKVILPFTCHGVTTLQQAGERQANVRLAKTVKMTTN